MISPNSTQHSCLIKGEGFYVTGHAENISVDWLVDTGCTITILSERRFSALKDEERPVLSTYEKELKSVDDENLKVLGQIECNIEIGNRLFQHTCVVANIANDGLLGFDFMKKHEVVIDFARNQISCEGKTLPARFK